MKDLRGQITDTPEVFMYVNVYAIIAVIYSRITYLQPEVDNVHL